MTALPLMSRGVADALALTVAAGAQADNGIDKKRREPMHVPPLIVDGLK